MFQFTWASILALAMLSGQSAKTAARVLVKIQPSEATLRVGESMQFTATVIGGYTGIKWSVEEKDGGTVGSDGLYTAPRRPGIFHLIATSEADPRARSLVKITAVIEADTDPPQY
jgi:chitinase